MMKNVKKILHDTLKKTGADGVVRFDYVKLTMFVSFIVANSMAIYALIVYGFRFDVFVTYMIVAVTGKIPDKYSKSIEKKNE